MSRNHDDNTPHYGIDKSWKAKDSDFVRHVHDFNLDIPTSQIYLMGEEMYGPQLDLDEPGVEYVMANAFIRNLNVLMRLKPNDPILIHMKTCGGFWTEGMAIYDAIKACPNPITILNYTHARSMSSIILQAANKRVMMPHSYFMFHDGTDGFEGTVKQLKSYYEHGRQADQQMIDIYVESMKSQGKFKRKSRKAIQEWLRTEMDHKEDVYISAKETVELGLADEIFGDPNYNWARLTEYTDEQLER